MFVRRECFTLQNQLMRLWELAGRHHQGSARRCAPWRTVQQLRPEGVCRQSPCSWGHLLSSSTQEAPHPHPGILQVNLLCSKTSDANVTLR